MIRNPILPGFNQGPSICRVGPDCCIATGAFGWSAGKQGHPSAGPVPWPQSGA